VNEIALFANDGRVMCDRCRVADSFGSRFFGLMGKATLPRGEGLLFPRTSSVHTHFMRFPIDVVFRDADGRVLSIVRNLRPWRFARCRGAADVLELPGGESDRVGLGVGTLIVDDPADGLTPSTRSGAPRRRRGPED
jgi:uncharacterized membrane protein (UPF0127 family)